MVEHPHVEVESLVDQGTNLRIFRVESIVLSVFVDQICANSSAFVQVKAIVVDGGDVVLRIHLDVFGLHVVTGHHVRFLQVQFNADHFGRHHDGAARGAGLQVVQVDRHVETNLDTCQKPDKSHFKERKGIENHTRPTNGHEKYSLCTFASKYNNFNNLNLKLH